MRHTAALVLLLCLVQGWVATPAVAEPSALQNILKSPGGASSALSPEGASKKLTALELGRIVPPGGTAESLAEEPAKEPVKDATPSTNQAETVAAPPKVVRNVDRPIDKLTFNAITGIPDSRPLNPPPNDPHGAARENYANKKKDEEDRADYWKKQNEVKVSAGGTKKD